MALESGVQVQVFVVSATELKFYMTWLVLLLLFVESNLRGCFVFLSASLFVV